jgi:hypothetical protein
MSQFEHGNEEIHEVDRELDATEAHDDDVSGTNSRLETRFDQSLETYEDWLSDSVDKILSDLRWGADIVHSSDESIEDDTAIFKVYEGDSDSPSESEPIYVQKVQLPPEIIDAGLQGGDYILRLFGPAVSVELAKWAVGRILRRIGKPRSIWERDDGEYGGYSSNHGYDFPGGRY